MRIGLPALSLAHVPKADATPLYPFGSAFWHNLARMTWSLTRAGGEDHEVILAHRKHNAYAALGKVLLTISWDDDGPAEVTEKPYAMALGDRIAEALEDGPATVAAIVETLNDDAGEDGARVKADTIRHALRRGLKAGRFRLDGEKWRLAA